MGPKERLLTLSGGQKEHEVLCEVAACNGGETPWFVWEPGNMANCASGCEVFLSLEMYETQLGNIRSVSCQLTACFFFFTSFWQKWDSLVTPIPFYIYFD